MYCKKSFNTTTISIIKNILPTRIKILYGIICLSAVFVNLLEGIGAGLIIPLLEVLSKGTDLDKHSHLVQQLLLLFKHMGIHPTVLSFLTIIFFLITLRYTLALLHARFIDTTLHKTTDILRNRAFNNLMDVSIEYYHNSKVGELTNFLINESLRGMFVIRSIINLISVIILALFYIGILAVFSFKAMIIILALSIIASFLMKKIISRTRDLGAKKSKFNSTMNIFCIEVLNSIIFVKSFLLENRIKGMFRELSFTTRKNWISLSFNRRLLEYLSNIFQITSLTLLIFILLEIFHFSIGYLIGTIFILFRLLPFINQINNYRREISDDLAGLENIYELSLKENKPYIQSGNYNIKEFRDYIEFREVSFSYKKDKKVLNKINFKIEKGETVGIIGSSGAGKSTLIFLIPRFYDVTTGKIIVDGLDIKELDINSWRKKVGIITQETFIFNDTIRNNLLIVKPDASENELQIVLELSHLKEVVANMPEGLDTLVGDRGINLSGGQKQRLAMARVFLKNPEILIMDEATSSLDNISERFIQQSTEELRKERTVIIIAHRLSTIKNVDKIIVLENGDIVEEGSPYELLEKKGQYFKYLQH